MENRNNKISHQAEEYLEAIYRLETESGSAKTMELAKKLKVVPGSITNTIDNLERKGLVVHEPYKGVKLTEAGRRIASNILKRHRLAERLLTDFLHIDWSEVHEPACKLEHALDPEIIKPLETALGNPITCPHGNRILQNKESLIEENTKPLSFCKPKDKCIIKRISDEDPNTLKILGNLKIVPGTHVIIRNNDPSLEFLEILINGNPKTLDRKLAFRVRVKPEKVEA